MSSTSRGGRGRAPKMLKSSFTHNGDKFLSKDYISKMRIERFKAFKAQDLEKGYFDVTFEIEGKILHAHKFILTIASDTMGAMLADRWSTKDESVKISSCSYDSFYQFLCFIYSGCCKIDKHNAFKLTDMAEFYGVSSLKDLCDEALSMMEITVETIEEMYEHASLYLLPKLTTSIKNFISRHAKDVYRIENFLAFKKQFVEFLSSNKCELRSEFFESVYKWAEQQVLRQKSGGDENFDLQDAVKTELSTILPHIEFCHMDPKFLMNFVVEKGFFLSAEQFSKLITNNRAFRSCAYSHTKDDVFKSVYELAEKQALQKQKMSSDKDSFDLDGTIKADFAKVILQIEFDEMNENFLLDFVVEKCGFTFSSAELSRFYHGLSITVSLTEENRFQRVYRLAEKQALQKQKMSSDEKSFNIVDSIKADLSEILPLFEFYKMDQSFLHNFVVEKCGFSFSSAELSRFYRGLWNTVNTTKESRFQRIYELAEKQALQKQKMSSDVDNFDLAASIKTDLVETIPLVKFYEMNTSFLMDFVIENGIILSPTDLSKFYQDGYSSDARFKKVYQLAEKQALQKQKMSSDDDFDVAETIKADLSETIPHVKFYEMDKEFLMDFVLAKGLITEEQTNHVYDIIFEVENDGQSIRGTLEDNIEICRIVQGGKSFEIRRRNLASTKRRFLKFVIPIPSTPSTVTKMVGCEWYLCLEKDKVLTLKHHSIVKRSDYLLVAMEGDADFELNSDEMTLLTAKCNNI